MSDPRYQPGIIQGMALSRTHGTFPDVPALGPKRGGQPFGRCMFCGPAVHPQQSGTFVTYGGRYACGRCARLLATQADSPEVKSMLARAGSDGS